MKHKTNYSQIAAATGYRLPATGHFRGNRGVTVMLVLVFMGIFIFVLSALSGYVLQQAKQGRAKYTREQAFHVAEAGLEYYRWFLAHNPGDLQDGTGQGGVYTHDVADPEGGTLGSFALSITGNSYCGVLQSVDISSEGSATADPQYKRTLSARYAKPSVAEYAYIINASVWAGADRTIVGPYHANGGIRMDGTNNSTVTSSVESWTCTSSFGCSPSQTVSGVWGAGSGSALWSYPAPQVDFAGIATDFNTLSNLAQANGLRFATAGGQDRRGWHLKFYADNTVDVWKVMGTQGVWAIKTSNTSQWVIDYDTITNEQYQGRYTIPSDCPVIFVQDKVWVEGVVGSKVTLVAAHPGNPYEPDIVIQNNITYAAGDGTVGLTAIAEGSVRIPLVIPDSLSINGIFIAQTGYFGRDLYPCWYSPYDKRTLLTMNGSVVSNQRVGTKWSYSGVNGCSSGNWSGFGTRNASYDKLLATDPPPFTPFAGVDARFVDWREQ